MPALDIADVTTPIEHESEPWVWQIAGDFDVAETDNAPAIWDDWGVVDALRRESRQQEQILCDLIRLTECSINGYVEILEFASDVSLINFAEVVLRQRAAQLQELRENVARKHSSAGWEQDSAELNKVWRVAIWNLEQDRQRDFFELTGRAEAQLEEAFLTAARAFRDAEWSSWMTECAVAVCGARMVWEEIGETESVALR